MKMRELEMTLAAADPVDRAELDWVRFEEMEAELLADLDDERPASSSPTVEAPRRHRPRRLALALSAAAVAAIAAVVVFVGGGSGDHSSRAYGAELVRFAESTPLLLLEGPGWRVEDVFQYRGREGAEGSMEFVTGKPLPDESLYVHEDGTVTGMLPPSVRQRKVELSWRHGDLAETIHYARRIPHPHGQRWIELPVLGTTAQVDTRADFYADLGGPGDRHMVAFWAEGGYILEMRAAVPDQAAFEERLDWLQKVDSQTWLDAMPAKVVKAAEHDAAVREMLKGIPVPETFKPSRVPDEGLTTNRYQVAGSVTATVSCLWFLQWDKARRQGDRAARLEAERAMATSKRWPILREMTKDGAYPNTIWQLAAEMPQGYWDFRGQQKRRLLAHAETLACARLGLPLLPWKQQRQRERGDNGRP
ncbi:MAG TPA: hypothetical protein VFY75_08080 [Solirubrobacterales bacterium]|nr:hypothetical protein [Solirubrobacterales bacterium]